MDSSPGEEGLAVCAGRNDPGHEISQGFPCSLLSGGMRIAYDPLNAPPSTLRLRCSVMCNEGLLFMRLSISHTNIVNFKHQRSEYLLLIPTLILFSPVSVYFIKLHECFVG